MEPIRCFDGIMQPHQPFWTVRNANESKSGDPELEFYGYISEYSWFGDEITPAAFKTDLYNLGKGGPVTVRINSGGGDVIASSMIRATLLDYPGHVTVRIDGLAASAAVIVAMAGKTIKIQDTAFMMIHDPAFSVMMAVLDIETLGQWQDQLKSIKAGIVDVYAAKTGMSQDRLKRMMTDETWMSANEAVNYGFADEVIVQVSGKQNAAAKNVANAAVINSLRSYRNLPVVLQEMLNPETPDIQNQMAMERLRAEIKLYV